MPLKSIYSPKLLNFGATHEVDDQLKYLCVELQEISHLREQLHNLWVCSSIVMPLVYTQVSVSKLLYLNQIKRL